MGLLAPNSMRTAAQRYRHNLGNISLRAGPRAHEPKLNQWSGFSHLRGGQGSWKNIIICFILFL